MNQNFFHFRLFYANIKMLAKCNSDLRTEVFLNCLVILLIADYQLKVTQTVGYVLRIIFLVCKNYHFLKDLSCSFM